MFQFACPSFKKTIFVSAIGLLAGVQQANAQADSADAHELTEIYTPVPPIVTPGTTFADAPSDAIILFDGKNQDEWLGKDGTAPSDWIISKGALTVNKKAGGIQTKRSFTNYQLHIEWKVPTNITGEGQARGNSGVFLASTGPGDEGYELQVLDCYNNKTYVNGQTAAIYKQGIPLANACKKPGEWQAYDVIWTAPTFNTDGSLATPAHVTAFHNGVLVQNNFELKGVTRYRGKPYYKAHGATAIKLQAHGDKSEPISFKNIWIRPL
ncbi:3-keto-disaccharide hydrolase [Flavitalea flava]